MFAFIIKRPTIERIVCCFILAETRFRSRSPLLGERGRTRGRGRGRRRGNSAPVRGRGKLKIEYSLSITIFVCEYIICFNLLQFCVCSCPRMILFHMRPQNSFYVCLSRCYQRERSWTTVYRPYTGSTSCPPQHDTSTDPKIHRATRAEGSCKWALATRLFQAVYDKRTN